MSQIIINELYGGEKLSEDLIGATIINIGHTQVDGMDKLDLVIKYITKGGQDKILTLGFDDGSIWINETGYKTLR